MKSDIAQLRELLGLQPSVTETMPFGEFLTRLKEHPEMADTAAALLVRAIESRGEVDLENVTPERRPYLKMLKQMRVSSWKAFDKVRGSQKTVARIMNHLRAAAANGYQLRLALILKGGPGCGKSFLAEAIKEVLEGEVIYAVKGCPVHENPVNLLTLLPPEALNALAKTLKMTEEDCAENGCISLKDLLAVAGKPCQKCWSKVMDGKTSENPPNLFDMEVTGLRLSSRKFGISTWTGNSSLQAALENGSRGVVDMPELFTIQGPNGPSSELDLLLDATNDRRIPAAATELSIPGLPLAVPNPGAACGSETGWLPLDAVLLGQTNDGAWEEFIKRQPDPNKFTRRFFIMNVPYITSVAEEELAYRDKIADMRDQPHLDPMALKIAALLAVISRMKKDHEVDIVTRARMYDGEQLLVAKKSSSLTSSPTYSSGGFGGGWGSNRPTSNSGKTEQEYWSVAQFWAEAGEDEGMYGLNMAVMLSAVSQIVDLALKEKHRCISTLSMLNFLRAKIQQLKKTPGLTSKEKEVLTNCEEFLKPPTYKDSDPGLLEKEYRRVLRRQFLEVMAPDFEQRASELFEKYRLHAGANARGESEVTEIHHANGRDNSRRVKVDTAFLDDLEKWMGLSYDEKKTFRMSIEAEIAEVMRQHARTHGDEACTDVVISWRTLPKLALGIQAKLNDEIAKKLERVLRAEIELSDEEKVLRREALERFDQLGYCEHCREQALTYFKDYELWK